MATVNGSAALLAGPKLTAAGAVSFTVKLSAAAVIQPTARLIRPGSASFSAAGTLTVKGFVPMMTASAALSATAKVTHPGAAALHAPGTLTAATSQSAAHLAAAPSLLAPGRAGAARFSAGTSLTASGQYFMPGQVAIFAGPVLTAGGKVTSSASVSLRASTALTAAALLRVVESAAMTAPGTLTAGTSQSAAHLAAAPSLSAAGMHIASGGAALHAPGTATAAARVTELAAGAFHGSPVLSAQAVISRAARAPLSAFPHLSAAGAVHARQLAAGALQASAVLHAAGIRGQHGSASLASAAVLSARGIRSAAGHAALTAPGQVTALAQVTSGARLTATASLSGTAGVSRAARAVLSAGAQLTAGARGTILPGAAFKAPGVLVPSPTGVVKGATAFACSPSLAAQADTRPKVPFPLRPRGQQPAWERDVQRFAIVQERQRHAQALWQYGELMVFALMWRPQDIDLGLAQRCTRCYTPRQVISDLSPGTVPPLGWPTALNEAAISAAYGQGSQYRCTLCFGTQVIATQAAEVPGVRALLVRPAILTDTDQNQQRSAKGVVNPGSVQVQTTPDFRVHTMDYCFRSDGRRYQLSVPARTTLRTGFGSPWQAAAGISYNLASASLEDPKASVAYVIPPPAADLASVLGTYTRVPADYAWFEQRNGPLVPGEEPPPAAYGFQQPTTVLGS